MKMIVILFVFQIPAAFAHPGVGIVMDSKGNVYYTDLKQIFKINKHGEKTIVVHNVHSHELYIDSLDNLYGEHLWYDGDPVKTWRHYIWKLSSNGKIEKIALPSESIDNTFSFVHDSIGNSYLVDRTNTCQKIIRKNARGTETKLNSCLSKVRWITVTPSGVLYTIDFHDLKRIDHRGDVTTVAENIPNKTFSQAQLREQHYLSGISTDKTNNVYVADYSGRQVKKVSLSGKISVVAETEIPWSPSAQIIAPNGDFWVLEYSSTNTVRVERISLDGKRTIY